MNIAPPTTAEEREDDVLAAVSDLSADELGGISDSMLSPQEPGHLTLRAMMLGVVFLVAGYTVIAMVIGSAIAADALPHWLWGLGPDLLGNLMCRVWTVLVVVHFLWFRTHRTLRESLRLRAVSRRQLASTLTYSFALAASVLIIPHVAGVTVALDPTGLPGELWLQLIASVFAASVVEELQYRVFLFEPLEKKLGPTIALGITAVLFGLSHLPNYAGSPPYEIVLRVAAVTLFGVLLGSLRVRTGSIVPSMVCHASWNAAVVARMFLS